MVPNCKAKMLQQGWRAQQLVASCRRHHGYLLITVALRDQAAGPCVRRGKEEVQGPRDIVESALSQGISKPCGRQSFTTKHLELIRPSK
ncbi:hypothetical protein VTN49DRAFT_4397 [Thermomyces lanuginosus]|uniref:uncharacterized protein n=1 Tax=Thermomyces lanuginosus TaxID=5541 RepID=UPI003743E907